MAAASSQRLKASSKAGALAALGLRTEPREPNARFDAVRPALSAVLEESEGHLRAHCGIGGSGPAAAAGKAQSKAP
jgi:hypothetical protein